MKTKAIFEKIQKTFQDKLVVRMLYALFMLITFFSLMFVAEKNEDKTLIHEDFEQTFIDGEYSIDGGATFQKYINYDDIEMYGIKSLTIRGRLRDGLEENESLYMFNNYIDTSLYINDEIKYVSDSTANYGWDVLTGIRIKTSDVVTVELMTRRPVRYAYGFRMFLDRLNKSTKAAVLFHEIDGCLLLILGDLILLIIGFIMIVTGIETNYSTNAADYGIANCGVAMVLGAMTCFVNPKYITLIIDKFEVLEFVDALLQVFTVLFIFAYFRKLLKREENRQMATGLVVTSYTVACVFMLWSSIGYPAGIIPVMIEIVSGVVIGVHYIWLFVRESIDVSEKMDLIAVGAALFLVVSTCVEMLYFLYAGVFLVHALETGLLVFASAQIWFVVNKASRARRETIRLKDVENELTKAQVNSMISQIQPHFLYNALSTIRALCTKDPKRAREAIDLLSKYLRANMESLTTKETIPIKKELEHVECYLSIEKYRFGDKLNVEYDIQSTDFRVPSMTIQTLAENAVKHGLLAKPEGGTLKISTSESEYCYVVNIVDDGVGFDRTDGKNEKRVHVGIENSRKRLATMCNGNLSIGSIAGKGTTVTICIPK